MKKTVIIILLGLLSIPGFGQLSGQGVSMVSLSTGRALAGGVSIDDTTLSYSKTNGQVFSLAYDYFITDHFSMGFLVANQVIGIEVNDTMPGGQEFLLEEGKVNRLYTGFRGTWHYGNSEFVRFYSGFRFGVVTFSSFGVDQKFAGESNIEKDNNRTRYSLGITPIGINIFVVENLALHLETNFGAPGFFFMGANYRF